MATKVVQTNPTYWLVRVIDCRHIQRQDYADDAEDPINGMALGDDTEENDEDDAIADFRVNSVPVSKAKKKRITLQCPGRNLVLETSSFVWPYPVWMTVRIEIHTYVIAPSNHVIADSLQKGRFTPLEYFITDWLVSTRNSSGINDSIDLTGGLGNVYGVSLVSQFLSFLRPEMQGNSETDLIEVQSYDKYKALFCEYLDTRPVNDVRLNNIPTLLSEYANDSQTCQSSSVPKQQVVLALNQQLTGTEEGQLLQLSGDAPDLFRLGPLLFPRKIRGLMIRPSEDSPSVASSKKELYQVLDEIIISCPWKLGFANMIYKAMQEKCTGKKWSGIEAQLRHMKKATFYTELARDKKDALHVYDTIKDTCRRDGHTYLFEDDVANNFAFRKDKVYEGYRVSNFYETLEFLVDHQVLHRDCKNGRLRYHLMVYWQAEQKIRNGLVNLLNRKPPKESRKYSSIYTDYEDNERFNVDFSLDCFKRISTDAQQRLAAEKICSKEVVIISGRGGTGKTEVVTTALSYLDQLFQENEDCNGGPDCEIQDNSHLFAPGNENHDKSKTCPLDCVDDLEKENNQSKSDKSSEPNGRILYVAPTGKAAAVMRKRSKKNAYTIHQVLFSYRRWRLSSHTGEQSGPWKFAETRVCAVDECSMVSVVLFSSLIECLQKASRLMKVILLGDVLQLPSIDPGNFMEDLFNAFRPEGLALELETNHRSEGSLIFENAKRISNRKLPHLHSAHGFELLTPDPEELPNLPSEACRGAHWLPPISKISDRIRLRKQPSHYAMGVEEAKQSLYLSLLRNGLNRYGLENPRTSQFIAFKRIECGFVNELCVPVYNNHTILDFEKNVVQILIGDKIMVTKNTDVPLYFPPKQSEDLDSSKNNDSNLDITNNKEAKNFETKEVRLMNGSVYMIEDIREAKAEEKKKQEESVDTENDEEVKTVVKNVKFFLLDDLADEFIRPNCKVFAKLCKPCHAYALTIHKFQGSEADTIVYGVSNSKMETWKHVYTAVTRGKKRVVIVGTWENLAAAVRRKSRPRQTALQEKMCKVMSKLKKGEAPVIEEDEPEKDNVNQPSEVDKSTLDQHKFTSIRERVEQLEKERPNIECNIVKNNSMCASMLRNNLTQKRNNTVMDKQQCNSTSKSIRMSNNKKSVQNSFPDDSFNEIVSQMPDSELNQFPASSRPKAGDNTAHLAPIFCNTTAILDSSTCDRLCSTPKMTNSHNDSSFEIQMSQMTESEFKHFTHDV